MSDEKGYPKWAVPNTSTVSDDPANEVNRSKGEPNKLPPSVNISGNTETVTDGTTSTKYSAEHDPVLKALGPKNLSFGPMAGEKQHYPPCINPSCKSYGHSHPNCLCYSGPGGSSLEQGHFAHGGAVCSGMHKEDCEHYASGGEIAENTKIHNSPGHAVDHVAVHHGLLGLMTKTGHSKSQNINKPTEDFISHARNGHKAVHASMEKILLPHRIEPDKDARESLKNHLQDLREHPEKLLEVGGNLGDNLPGHAAQLAVKAGDAVNHFNAIRPVQTRSHPLDELTPINKRAQEIYDRHIDIANQPLTLMNHVKDGTLVPSDVLTLKALYPDLHKSLVDKAGEAIITAKTNNAEIPYKLRQSLSLMIGQPLDSTMTPASMQAIIHSAGPQPGSEQPQKPAKPKKATGVELNQINKINAMDFTSTQDRVLDKSKD